jgi:hypothetical protein
MPSAFSVMRLAVSRVSTTNSDYFEQKGHALAALAALLERILHPPTANVVMLGAVS